MSKPNVEVYMKHLKVLLKWSWSWILTCVWTICLGFRSYLLDFPWKIIFGVISSGNCLYISLAFRKCRNDCNRLKVILVHVQGFCPFKTEIARFPSGFHLNFSVSTVALVTVNVHRYRYYNRWRYRNARLPLPLPLSSPLLLMHRQ